MAERSNRAVKKQVFQWVVRLVPKAGTVGFRHWHSWFLALEPTVSGIVTKIETIVKYQKETAPDGFKCKIVPRKSAGCSAG
jgi:hypothetical protein